MNAVRWVKIGSVWIGTPRDDGIIGVKCVTPGLIGTGDLHGVRCYVIGRDSTRRRHCILTAVLEEGKTLEVEEDTGAPAGALERLQFRAEEHYRGFLG